MMDRSCIERKSDVDRTLDLELENARLQRLVAELLMKNQTLRDMLHHVEAKGRAAEILVSYCAGK
jgi:hypothetical protein